MSRPRRRAAAWLVAATIFGGALLVAACSDDDTASTTTTAPSTTAPTTTTTPTQGSSGSKDPLPVAWVRQVGGAGDDSLAGATGKDDAVLAVGTTTGLTPTDRPASGSTAAFVDVVNAADGTSRATVQSTQAVTATAGGVSSATDADLTLTCGTTAEPTRRSDDGAAGGTDAWCAPLAVDGTIGAAARAGSDLADSLTSVAVAPDGTHAYAAGRAEGLFPAAKDPTGGYLGDGDALVTSIESTGAMRWARQFGTTSPDDAAAVTTSDDGDAIVAGSTSGRTEGDPAGTLGAADGWIARMDPGGQQRWMTQFGTAGDDRALAVAAGGDPRRGTETFVAAGDTNGAAGTATNLGGTDALVAAFDASGRQLWTAQLGSTADDVATGVVVDGSTVYVTGTAAAEIVGGQQISLTPTPTDEQGGTGGTGGTTTAPSTTAPTTTAPPTGGGKDGFLAAIDASTGAVQWIAQWGSTGDEVVTGMSRTESGLIVVSGSTTGQLTATPPGGATDGFLVAFVPPSGGGGAASMV